MNDSVCYGCNMNDEKKKIEEKKIIAEMKIYYPGVNIEEVYKKLREAGLRE